MRALRRACHKFESRNLETLIGAPLDEDPELWDRRSPITQVHRVRAPVLVGLSIIGVLQISVEEAPCGFRLYMARTIPSFL